MPAAQHFQNPKPVYLLCSNEPLLLRDWLDDAKRVLHESGIDDIQHLIADAGFRWQDLVEESGMMSLFSDKKCRIVTLPGGKPGQQGSKVIQALVEQAGEDNLYIFVMPLVDSRTRNTNWFKAVREGGDVVELKPVEESRLANWILNRAQQKSLHIDLQSAQFLAERTEGNLLAADQELEKLSIRSGSDANVDFATIEESVSHSARYSHFVLVEACLCGKHNRALKILNSLRAEGYVTTQLRWAIQASLQQLDQLKQLQAGAGLNDRSWQQMRIWNNKKAMYKTALTRLSGPQIERLLQSCATLDRLGKGQQDSFFPDQEWIQVKSLIVDFCAGQ